jgi:hypothetical protein
MSSSKGNGVMNSVKKNDQPDPAPNYEEKKQTEANDHYKAND